MIERVFASLLLVCGIANAQTVALLDRWNVVCAGRLFIGTDKVSTNPVVLINGARIAEIVPSEKVKIPAGSEVDLSQATLLPGLIDAPTHIFGNRPDFETLILRQTYQHCTEMARLGTRRERET